MSFSDEAAGGGEILESWVRRVVIMVFIDMFIASRVVFHTKSVRQTSICLWRVLQRIVVMVCRK